MCTLDQILVANLLTMNASCAVDGFVEAYEVRQIIHNVVVTDVGLELLKVTVYLIEYVATISILLLALLALILV